MSGALEFELEDEPASQEQTAAPRPRKMKVSPVVVVPPAEAPDVSADYVSSRDKEDIDNYIRSAFQANEAPPTATGAALKAPPQADPTVVREEAKTAGPELDPMKLTAAHAIAETAGYRAVGHGVIEGVNEAFQTVVDVADPVADFLNENVADLGEVQVFDKDWKFAPKYTPKSQVEGSPQVRLTPNIDAPVTVAGNIGSDISQFLTGFVTAGKYLKGLKGGWGALGKGAISDAAFFDPHESRLSNILDNHPDWRQPITDFLRADPKDTSAAGRFKRAIEGAGAGVVVGKALEYGLAGLRQLRSIKLKLADAEPPTPTFDEEFGKLGDTSPEAPIVKPRPLTDKGGEPQPGGIDVNWAKINEDEDVLKLMDWTVRKFERDAKKAMGGPVTHEQTKLDALEVDAWDTLQGRRQGTPLPAAEALAVRELWAQSGRKLWEVAQVARGAPNTANLFTFRKMIAIHKAIQEQVLGVRSATARALNAWAIPTGGGAERMKQIEGILDDWGGQEATEALAQRIAALNSPGQVSQAVEKAAEATTIDAAQQVGISGMLWSPKTHAYNAVSNAGFLAAQMAEHAIAARLPKALNATTRVEAGEASAMGGAMVDGFNDAMRYAGRALKTGQSEFGTKQIQMRPFVSDWMKRAPVIGKSEWFGKTADFIGSGVGLSNRFLGAGDEFFKVLNHRAGIAKLAWRQANEDLSTGALKSTAERDARYQELKANPTQQMDDEAREIARYGTFTSPPGGFTRGVIDAARHVPLMRVSVMPFVNTPANLMKRSIERTPFAPILKSVRQELARGGASADLALARMGLGTFAMMSAADLAMKGQLVGAAPPNPAEREEFFRAGKQPYSINLFGKWIPFGRTDPVGTQLAMAADFSRAAAMADWDEIDQLDASNAWADAVTSIAASAAKKSYLSDSMQLSDMLHESMRGRGGEAGSKFLADLTSSFVPFSSVFGTVERVVDPLQRVPVTEEGGFGQDFFGKWKAGNPWLSHELPVAVDLWGRQRMKGTGNGFADLLPFMPSGAEPEPIDQEFMKLGAYIASPAKTLSLDQGELQGILGVQSPTPAEVSLRDRPAMFERYKKLAGDEIKLPVFGNLTARETVNAIVTDQHRLSAQYNRLTADPNGGPDSKLGFLRRIVEKYREAAKYKLLQEYPELGDAFRMRVQERKRFR